MWRRTDAGYLILSGNRAIVKRCRIKCTERKSPVYAPMKEGCVLQAAEIPTVSYRKNHRRGKSGPVRLSFPDTDALITDAENVILTSLHADCIPVWLYDPERHAAGLVHAGWRGTRADIAAKTARKMCAEFGSALEDLLAFIGPGISRCCFEVGAEVAEEFAAMLGTEVFYGENGRYSIDDKNGKFHLDLKKINERLLQRAGLTKIAATNYCTCCSEDLSLLLSQRPRASTGRMCAGIMLL